MGNSHGCDLINSLSPQSYVSTWKKMKETESRKVFHLVDHEEKHHLEKTEEESKEIFQQLKESQYNMDLKQKLLRQIYEELKDLCHKPDMELIQVRMEDWIIPTSSLPFI